LAAVPRFGPEPVAGFVADELVPPPQPAVIADINIAIDHTMDLFMLSWFIFYIPLKIKNHCNFI
jgi:hypothetical protein